MYKSMVRMFVLLAVGNYGCATFQGPCVRADPLTSNAAVKVAPLAGADGGAATIEGLPIREADRTPADGDLRRPEFRPKFVPNRVACEEIADLATGAARIYGVEAALLVGLMWTESGFVANAISPAAAAGLTQLMHATADGFECGDVFDPAQNVDCGTRVLASFLKRFNGNLVRALAGYNAGMLVPIRAERRSTMPSNAEYVERVLQARARYLRHGCSAFD